VAKQYENWLRKERVAALCGVSFTVEPGEVCAFLGPNGAGKTTSINLLMGFLFPDDGEIRVLGYPPGDIRAKRQIGFLPENFAFYKYMTGPQLLRFHLALAGRSGGAAEARIPELLHKVKLDEFPDLKIGKYSRGMMQRLGIAQALLDDPQVLILDEPTSGLDPAARKEVRDLIAALKAEGKTIFLSSHILAEVEQMCDRVIIINRGRLLRAGPTQEMLGEGDRVEIVVDRLPEEIERSLEGATIERGPHHVRILVGIAAKRETAIALWEAECDVISIHPLKSSLEDFFLSLVGDSGEHR
jgi:ABC-2 type transport system ATP-binding protein